MKWNEKIFGKEREKKIDTFHWVCTFFSFLLEFIHVTIHRGKKTSEIIIRWFGSQTFFLLRSHSFSKKIWPKAMNVAKKTQAFCLCSSSLSLILSKLNYPYTRIYIFTWLQRKIVLIFNIVFPFLLSFSKNCTHRWKWFCPFTKGKKNILL